MQPAATKPSEPAKPAATKPAEPAKPAATKPAEPAKPAATKSAEPAKPAAKKPAEPTKPAATKPAEPVKPAATKPAEPAKPATAKPADPSKPAAAKGPSQTASSNDAKVVKQEVPAPATPALAERPARILAVIPYNSHSHNVMYAPLFRALALRGHTVHVLSHFPAENPPPTYRDLSIKGSYESWVDNVDMDLIASYANPLSVATLLWAETLDVCSKAMEHPATRKLLESNERYDLVVSEVFGAECMAGFAHKFRAPLVGLISSVAPPGALDRMGNPDHPAYTANYFLPYTERMTFWQRLANSFHGWAVRRLKYLLCDRPTDALARRYFGPDLPSTTELVQNTSLILVNTHYSINQPRPMVPGVVEVGGLHIGEPKPLPEELERYVSEAEAGVVVFSLGTMVRVSTWADERLRALWGALGALPQRVIIKSRDPLPSAPPNVRVERWLPQFDLL
ncbi:UDP-glucuronosyltransferase, partial [Gryllus bimaculatus]